MNEIVFADSRGKPTEHCVSITGNSLPGDKRWYHTRAADVLKRSLSKRASFEALEKYCLTFVFIDVIRDYMKTGRPLV
jgi:hypothetical protein